MIDPYIAIGAAREVGTSSPPTSEFLVFQGSEHRGFVVSQAPIDGNTAGLYLVGHVLYTSDGNTISTVSGGSTPTFFVVGSAPDAGDSAGTYMVGGEVYLSDGISEPTRLAAAAGSTAPPWQASTAYVQDQIVQRNGVLYARKSAGTSAASFVAADWQSLGSASTSQAIAPPWLASTSYNQYAIIERAGIIYRKKTAGLSAVTFTPANWDALSVTSAKTLAADWLANNAYIENEIVVNAGVLYRRIASGTSGATFATSDWELLIGGGSDSKTVMIGDVPGTALPTGVWPGSAVGAVLTVVRTSSGVTEYWTATGNDQFGSSPTYSIDHNHITSVENWVHEDGNNHVWEDGENAVLVV